MTSNQTLYDIILDKTTLDSQALANKDILFAAITDVLKTHPNEIDFRTGFNLNNFLHSNLLFTLKDYSDEVEHIRHAYADKEYIVLDIKPVDKLLKKADGSYDNLFAVIEVNNIVSFRVLSVEEAIFIAMNGFEQFKRNA